MSPGMVTAGSQNGAGATIRFEVSWSTLSAGSSRNSLQSRLSDSGALCARWWRRFVSIPDRRKPGTGMMP